MQVLLSILMMQTQIRLNKQIWFVAISSQQLVHIRSFHIVLVFVAGGPN